MELYTHLDIQYLLADKIKALRKEKKMTQKQMSHHADIPFTGSHPSRWDIHTEQKTLLVSPLLSKLDSPHFML